VFILLIGKTLTTLERETFALRVSRMKEIEITSMNRKYEAFRLKDKNRERYLLESIRGKGVQEPLVCAKDAEGRHILLDGFKRLRCCIRLSIPTVFIVTTGADEADSILRLIHQSNSRTLNILEQAVFVNTLRKEFNLSVSEIASSLERSLAWVSVRLGIFDEMSESIRQEVFSGRFPVRAYMYTLRRFTRVNKIEPEEADSALRMLGSGEPAYADVVRPYL
jgi:ParB/RepB/Spo0J family partition protein